MTITSRRNLIHKARSFGFAFDLGPELLGDALRCRQDREDGKPIGELEIATFQAALLIDRDGILEDKANEHAGRIGGRELPAIAIELPGATGFRADIELAPGPLPYVYVFALGSHDLGIDGGLLVTVRCASPEWPAAEAALQSLRFLDRRGKPIAAPDADPAALPLLGKRD